VLRFLAEDVGKNLDMVLDTIQRTLFSRGKLVGSCVEQCKSRRRGTLRCGGASLWSHV
jgi:hypothetical protein